MFEKERLSCVKNKHVEIVSIFIGIIFGMQEGDIRHCCMTIVSNQG